MAIAIPGLVWPVRLSVVVTWRQNPTDLAPLNRASPNVRILAVEQETRSPLPK